MLMNAGRVHLKLLRVLGAYFSGGVRLDVYSRPDLERSHHQFRRRTVGYCLHRDRCDHRDHHVQTGAFR